jgi:hypothetical protein
MPKIKREGAATKNDLQQIINQNCVKHFSWHELVEVDANRDGWSGEKYVIPKMTMLQNIVPAILFAESLRRALTFRYSSSKGVVSVNSGYRPEDYNALVNGSADNSAHTEFRALDLEAPHVDIDEFRSMAAAQWQYFKLQINSMTSGFGVDSYNSIIHIDFGANHAAMGRSQRHVFW